MRYCTNVKRPAKSAPRSCDSYGPEMQGVFDLQVCDHETTYEDTGILDQFGDMIVRVNEPRPIGFGHPY